MALINNGLSINENQYLEIILLSNKLIETVDKLSNGGDIIEGDLIDFVTSRQQLTLILKEWEILVNNKEKNTKHKSPGDITISRERKINKKTNKNEKNRGKGRQRKVKDSNGGEKIDKDLKDGNIIKGNADSQNNKGEKYTENINRADYTAIRQELLNISTTITRSRFDINKSLSDKNITLLSKSIDTIISQTDRFISSANNFLLSLSDDNYNSQEDVDYCYNQFKITLKDFMNLYSHIKKLLCFNDTIKNKIDNLTTRLEKLLELKETICELSKDYNLNIKISRETGILTKEILERHKNKIEEERKRKEEEERKRKEEEERKRRECQENIGKDNIGSNMSGSRNKASVVDAMFVKSILKKLPLDDSKLELLNESSLSRNTYIYSLEERITCSLDCRDREDCVGDNIRKFRIIVSDRFYEKLNDEIKKLSEGFFYKDGFNIFLHGLGDFPSIEYLEFWELMLDKYKKLFIVGRSRRKSGEIYNKINELKNKYGERFDINTDSESCD